MKEHRGYGYKRRQKRLKDKRFRVRRKKGQVKNICRDMVSMRTIEDLDEDSKREERSIKGEFGGLENSCQKKK